MLRSGSSRPESGRPSLPHSLLGIKRATLEPSLRWSARVAGRHISATSLSLWVNAVTETPVLRGASQYWQRPPSSQFRKTGVGGLITERAATRSSARPPAKVPGYWPTIISCGVKQRCWVQGPRRLRSTAPRREPETNIPGAWNLRAGPEHQRRMISSPSWANPASTPRSLPMARSLAPRTRSSPLTTSLPQ